MAGTWAAVRGGVALGEPGAGLPLSASARVTRPLFTSRSLHALRNHQLVSHAKATRELGYEPRPLRQTIIDTYEWFREAGRLS